MVLRLLEVLVSFVVYLRAEILRFKENNKLNQSQKTLNMPPVSLLSMPEVRLPASSWTPWSLPRVRYLFFFNIKIKWMLEVVSNWGISALEANFVCLSTEWLPRWPGGHLPNRSFLRTKVEYMLETERASILNLDCELSRHWDIHVNNS